MGPIQAADHLNRIVLLTRPPIGQQRQQVEDAHGAIAIEVGRPAGVGAPGGEEQDNIQGAEDVLALHGR